MVGAVERNNNTKWNGKVTWLSNKIYMHYISSSNPLLRSGNGDNTIIETYNLHLSKDWFMLDQFKGGH